MIEYVTASHDPEVLNNNLLKSEVVYKHHPLTVQTGFNNISKAYNAAKACLNTVVWVHHDVFLPPDFEMQLNRALTKVPDDWGVLGVAGVKLVGNKKDIKGYILDRGKKWGSPIGLPAEVDTLDEMLLITRGKVTFDENLDLDFYGADICMQAIAAGKKNYAINAFCHHNSTRVVGGRTESFYRCQAYFRKKWRAFLPIATTCALITAE